MLLCFCGSTEGDKDQDSLLGTQAIRMVQILKLPNPATVDPVDKEIEILRKAIYLTLDSLLLTCNQYFGKHG